VVRNTLQHAVAVAVAIAGVLAIAVLTGLKQAMKKYEETDPPAWIGSVVKILRKALEYATANDGQSK